MMTRLGHTTSGQMLAYDENLYEFRLDTVVTPFADIATLDAQGQILWKAMEQRDWFHKIDPEQLEACNKRAFETATYYTGPEATNPHDQVRIDAARDDSILAGKIVDADPALVQAVIDELGKQGIYMGVPGEGPGPNPLAVADLPKGMEALSQFERAQVGERKMTRSEERLMKKILKNDDREKARREKEADAIDEANEKAEEKARKKVEETTGADGDLEVPPSEEEIALLEMRTRNAEQNLHMYTSQQVFSSSGVPTARLGGSLGTNPDGSPKQTGMSAYMRKRKEAKDERKQLEKRTGGKKRRGKGKRRKGQDEPPANDEAPRSTATGNYADAESYADSSSSYGSTQTGGQGAMGMGGQGGMGGGMGMGGGPGGGMGGGMGGGGMGGPGGGMGGGGGQGGANGVIGLLQNILNIASQVLRLFGGGGGGGGMR